MSATSSIEHIVRVHEEEDPMWAEVLDLPGCFASGDTLDGLREALEEAISLYLTDNPEWGSIKDMDKVSGQGPHRPMQVGEMRVLIPQ